MKKVILNFRLLGMVTLAVATLSLASCAKKGCTDERADNFNTEATEDDGSCNATETVAKYKGTFVVNEACPATDTYTIEIKESQTVEYRFLIENFYGTFSDPVFANVSKNTFIIPEQTINIFTITGSGSISGDTLTFSFSITSSSGDVTCTATGVRQ